MVRKTKPTGYWNKERCIEEASKYNNISEWKKNNETSYNVALKNGWSEECNKHMVRKTKPTGYWNKERCIDSAIKYTNRSEWFKHDKRAYHASIKNGWFKECTKHMEYLVRPNGTWTKELLLIESKKWSTKKEWREMGEGYYRAVALGCFEECTKHMLQNKKPNGYWTKGRCIEESKKYNTRTKFEIKANGAYKSACRNKWINEIKELNNW